MGEDDFLNPVAWWGAYKYNDSKSILRFDPEEYEVYPPYNPSYKDCIEKLNEILLDVILDFSDSSLKLIQNDAINKLKIKIVIENKSLSTTIEYNLETHEVNGLCGWMSLGDRDLTEITKEEVEIIQKALLIWIYENI